MTRPPTGTRSSLSDRSIVTRLAAVLALAGSIAAVFLLVSSFMADEPSGPKGTRATTVSAEKKKQKDDPKTYVVVEGDTLSGIAARTGVSEAVLTRLNDDVDPGSLNAGQTLDLP